MASLPPRTAAAVALVAGSVAIGCFGAFLACSDPPPVPPPGPTDAALPPGADALPPVEDATPVAIGDEAGARDAATDAPLDAADDTPPLL